MINEKLLSQTLRAAGSGDLYVFAYGSLLWRPDFPHKTAAIGRIWGYCRRLAVWSFYYRGTTARPGLVFGLAAGGSCVGMIYRVRAADREQVVRILFKREMRTDIYQPIFLPATVGGKACRVLVFVVYRNSAQYAPPMSDAKMVKIIRSAAGNAGANADYIHNTHQSLAQLGIASPALARLCKLLGGGKR